MNQSENSSLEIQVKAAAEDGRIACARALDIAKKLAVSPREVGKAANRLKIKIVACQLGCFQ